MRTRLIRSALKMALLWGTVGIGLAVLFFLVSLRTDALADLELVFWPSSFAFMALDNARSTRLDWIEGTALLMFTNFVLYFIVGFLVTLAWKGLTRLKGHGPAASGLR